MYGQGSDEGANMAWARGFFYQDFTMQKPISHLQVGVRVARGGRVKGRPIGMAMQVGGFSLHYIANRFVLRSG